MGSYPSIIPESQVRWFLNEILKENLIGFSRFMLRTPYFFSGLEPSPCHYLVIRAKKKCFGYADVIYFSSEVSYFVHAEGVRPSVLRLLTQMQV